MYQGFLISISLYILYHSTKYYANFASLCLFCLLYFVFNNSPAKLDSLLDFERGFRPACEIRTGIFDPRTTFCRLGTSRSPLMACTGLPESLQCNIYLRAAKLTGDFPPFIKSCILYLTNIKKGEAGWMRKALFSCPTAKRKQYRFFVGCGFLRKKNDEKKLCKQWEREK